MESPPPELARDGYRGGHTCARPGCGATERQGIMWIGRTPDGMDRVRGSMLFYCCTVCANADAPRRLELAAIHAIQGKERFMEDER